MDTGGGHQQPIFSASEVYGWALSWFQGHANQRMQLVNFWFVAMSFLITGAIIADAAGGKWLPVVIGAGAAGSSVVFYRLDKRTQELIRYGEEVMAMLEQRAAAEGSIAFSLAFGMHDVNRRAGSYRVLFAALYLGGAIFGVAIGIYALAVS